MEYSWYCFGFILSDSVYEFLLSDLCSDMISVYGCRFMLSMLFVLGCWSCRCCWWICSLYSLRSFSSCLSWIISFHSLIYSSLSSPLTATQQPNNSKTNRADYYPRKNRSNDSTSSEASCSDSNSRGRSSCSKSSRAGRENYCCRRNRRCARGTCRDSRRCASSNDSTTPRKKHSTRRYRSH